MLPTLPNTPIFNLPTDDIGLLLIAMAFVPWILPCIFLVFCYGYAQREYARKIRVSKTELNPVNAKTKRCISCAYMSHVTDFKCANCGKYFQ